MTCTKDEPCDRMKSINFILGAMDGDAESKIRALIQKVSVQSWALVRLSILNHHSNREYAEKEVDKILERVRRASE